ncbi:hypothetical protein ABZ445_36930, partial [Streptomyces chartreusis]
MRAHLDLTHGLIVSERLSAELAPVLGRARAKDHGTSQALINLLIYLGVAAAVLIVLDLRRTEAKVPTDATEAAAVSVPIGAVP